MSGGLTCLSVIILPLRLLVGALTGTRVISSRVCQPKAVHAMVQHPMCSISQSVPAPTTTPIPAAATPSAPAPATLIFMPQALRGLHISLCDSGRIQNGAGQDLWNVRLLRYGIPAHNRACLPDSAPRGACLIASACQVRQASLSAAADVHYMQVQL